MAERIEYRVRMVPRYIVTRYHETENTGSSEPRGEYDNSEVAYQVGYALCRAEHEKLGWPLGDDRIRYPLRYEEDQKVREKLVCATQPVGEVNPTPEEAGLPWGSGVVQKRGPVSANGRTRGKSTTS